MSASTPSKEKIHSRSQPASRVKDAHEKRPEWLSAVVKSAKRQRLGKVLPQGVNSLQWGLVGAGWSADESAQFDVLRSLVVDGDASSAVRDAAESLPDVIQQAVTRPTQAVMVLAWAYAMPQLASVLEESIWWRNLEEIQGLCQSALDQTATESWQRLLLAGELGLALAWRLESLPSCAALAKPARKSFDRWGKSGKTSLTHALQDGARSSRLILASLVRQVCVREELELDPLSKSQRNLARKLFAACAVLQRPDGSAALSAEDPTDHDRDLWKAAAKTFEDEATASALKLGRAKASSKSGLADEAELPDCRVHDPDAGLVAWRASWRRATGRFAIHYGRDQVAMELGAGKSTILQGIWNSDVTVGGEALRPTGAWEQNCWFEDDEVFYFELQRCFAGSIRIQRQIMLAREAEWMLLSEGILAADGQSIDYCGHFPIAPGVNTRGEADTREWVLSDGKKERAVCIPLGLQEWKSARVPGKFEVLGDSLQLRMHGEGRLDAALAIDLRHGRFASPRTWRQLTVAENLRILPRDQAVGYRLQLADEQWLIYRTLATAENRTVLGKNVSIDFYVGKFDPSDGFYEDLLNIESDEE